MDPGAGIGVFHGRNKNCLREATLRSCGDLPVVATDDEITTPVEDRLVMTGVSCP
jgi:hypothetical protein